MQEPVPANALEKLLPVLVHIQANLDEDLSLDAVAKRARLSPFHFHRLFRAAIGETLKQYTQRLRLERAANRLVIHDTTILDVALDSGFQSHETFSRSFQRRFQVTPRGYREWGRGKLAQNSMSTLPLDEMYDDFELSETKVTRMAQLHFAFIRHVGPYEAVLDALAQVGRVGACQAAADRSDIPRHRARRTRRNTARQAALRRRDNRTRSVRRRWINRRINRRINRPPGAPPAEFAITTHIGHYRTLPQAYGTIVNRVGRLKGYSFCGLPAIEVYRTTRVVFASSLWQLEARI